MSDLSLVIQSQLQLFLGGVWHERKKYLSQNRSLASGFAVKD
jgi:hypothetical protein